MNSFSKAEWGKPGHGVCATLCNPTYVVLWLTEKCMACAVCICIHCSAQMVVWGLLNIKAYFGLAGPAIAFF